MYYYIIPLAPYISYDIGLYIIFVLHFIFWLFPLRLSITPSFGYFILSRQLECTTTSYHWHPTYIGLYIIFVLHFTFWLFPLRLSITPSFGYSILSRQLECTTTSYHWHPTYIGLYNIFVLHFIFWLFDSFMTTSS
jgi:hypothetical protein